MDIGSLFTQHLPYAQREARRVYNHFFGRQHWSDLQIDSIASDALYKSLEAYQKRGKANLAWLRIAIRYHIQKLVSSEKDEAARLVPIDNIDCASAEQPSLDYANELLYNSNMSNDEVTVVALHAISGYHWREVATVIAKTERQARLVFAKGICKLREKIKRSA